MMNSPINTFARIVFLATFSVLVGMCLYLVFVQRSVLHQLDRSIQIAEIASSRLVYGTVKSVDVSNRSITMYFTDPSSDKIVNVRVKIGDGAYIARQELEPVGAAIFTSLSSPSSGSLADITPGMRIAADIQFSASEELISMLILYGNPL